MKANNTILPNTKVLLINHPPNDEIAIVLEGDSFGIGILKNGEQIPFDNIPEDEKEIFKKYINANTITRNTD